MHEWLHRISPQVNIVGHTKVRHQWADPRRVIYDHELMLFGDGTFEVEFEDETYQLEGRSYIVIPPGRWHICRSIRAEGAARAWVHFDWLHPGKPPSTPILTYHPATPEPELYRFAPEMIPGRILHGKLPNASHVFELHERVEQRFNHGSGRMRASSRALVLELLLYVLSDTDDTRPTIGEGAAQSIRDALAELGEEPFDSADSIRDYLADRGQSYDHQARVFKQAYGITPLQFVNSLRIERACNLLRDTGMKVGEVARRLGFPDTVYFNRLFRQVTGKTPGQYRSR